MCASMVISGTSKSCENHVGQQERHALSPRNTTDACNFYRAKIVRTVYSIYFLAAFWAVFLLPETEIS